MILRRNGTAGCLFPLCITKGGETTNRLFLSAHLIAPASLAGKINSFLRSIRKRSRLWLRNTHLDPVRTIKTKVNIERRRQRQIPEGSVPLELRAVLPRSRLWAQVYMVTHPTRHGKTCELRSYPFDRWCCAAADRSYRVHAPVAEAQAVRELLLSLVRRP